MKTKVSHKRFYSLLAQMPGADKEQIVWEASGMLTTSLTTFIEKKPKAYDEMIRNMERSLVHRAKQENDIKFYRSAVLKRLQKYGVDTTDWGKINSFLQFPAIAGKLLYEMSIDELKALVLKMEALIAKKRIADAELQRQVQNN